jgi:hypothetical protein
VPNPDPDVSEAARQMSRKGWSMTENRSARTLPGRQSFFQRFADEPDPDAAYRAYMKEMSVKGIEARWGHKRRGGGNDAA